MEQINKEEIEKKYPKGTRIKLISMKDDYAVEPESIGTVDYIDDIGTIHINWDNGSTLGLIYGEDTFEIIHEQNLPKISKCSDLLKEIFISVKDSEAKMCYITEEEWKTDYSDNYTEKDISKLKVEVKKYNLQDVITFNDNGYKILGYEDLQTRFYDDRYLKNKERGDR